MLVSPVDGIVKTLEVNTDGGVLLLHDRCNVVPDDSQMLAEVEILNQDIGYVLRGRNLLLKWILIIFRNMEIGRCDCVCKSDAVWDERKDGYIKENKHCFKEI